MNKVTEMRRLLGATAWAMDYGYLQQMLAHAELLAAGGPLAEGLMASLKERNQVEAARRQQISASKGGAVAVLPIYGCITQRSSWMSYFFGGTTTEGFTQQFRQALADPNVTAIILDVDSPGGSVSGVDELAAEIYASRGKKKIVAISNTLNASAAYYLSSQASELVVSPSSLTGSIGVYQAHENDAGYLENIGVEITLISAGKFKVEGNPYEALSESARAAMQKTVDGYYKAFVKAVARGRGAKIADVINGYGEGRVLMSDDAVSAGLADSIGTLDSVLAKFGVVRPIDGSYAAADPAVPSAGEPVPVPETKSNKDEDEQDDDVPGDEDGDEDELGYDALEPIFKKHDRIKCVVLNACSTMNGISVAFAPLVIGMVVDIDDDDALAFSTGFYGALAAKRTPDEAFEQGVLNIAAKGGDQNAVAKLVLAKK